jgi:hypothetical protein
MPAPLPILVLRDGKPIQLGRRTELMILAIAEHVAEIEAWPSNTLRLHYGANDVQVALDDKLGFYRSEAA